jgi:hypothetical protein
MSLKLCFPLLFFFLLPSFILLSCNKDYSQEGNVTGGTAIFTYTGSPNACTDAVVGGTYQAGNALNSSNLLTLSVNVSATGNYSIITPAINGIIFSGSGIFSTSGQQTIQLTGSGIPVSAGTYSVSPGLNGCNFPVTVTGTAAYNLIESAENCSSFSIAGTYTVGKILTASNNAKVSVSITSPGTYTISTQNINGILFSASGSFTSTGIQTIQLNGSGTPLAAGAYSYTPGVSSCSITVLP